MPTQLIEPTPRPDLIPHTRVFGFGDGMRHGPFKFGGLIGSSIDHLGNEIPLHELVSKSTILRDYVGIHEIGMGKAERDEEGIRNWQRDDNITDIALEAGDFIYNNGLFRKRAGIVTYDACDCNGGRKLRYKGPDDISVRWVTSPDFKLNDEWRAEMGEFSVEEYVLLPPTGWIVMTDHGMSRRDIGTPFKTTTRKDRAIDSWTRRGISEDFTENNIPYYTRECEEGSGTVCVVRYVDGKGRFHVYVGHRPDFSSPGIGSYYIGNLWAKKRYAENGLRDYHG